MMPGGLYELSEKMLVLEVLALTDNSYYYLELGLLIDDQSMDMMNYYLVGMYDCLLIYYYKVVMNVGYLVGMFDYFIGYEELESGSYYEYMKHDPQDCNCLLEMMIDELLQNDD